MGADNARLEGLLSITDSTMTITTKDITYPVYERSNHKLCQKREVSTEALLYGSPGFWRGSLMRFSTPYLE